MKKFRKKINLKRKLVSVNHILTFGQIDDGRFEKIYSAGAGMKKLGFFDSFFLLSSMIGDKIFLETGL